MVTKVTMLSPATTGSIATKHWRLIYLNGAFNTNSTSVDAWVSQLSALRNKDIINEAQVIRHRCLDSCDI